MGGHGTVTVIGGSAALVDEAFVLIETCEALWSRFLPASDVTRLNWAEGAPVEVDPLTIRLIEAMREGAALTGGDFDPTLLPDLLTAGYRASRVSPSLETTLPASATSPGRLDDIAIEGMTVRMPVGTTLDAGGIGKGLAADLVCEFAMAHGAAGVMAELGGDIVVAGRAPDNRAWLLGIEDPFETTEHLTTVCVVRGAIVTSSQRKRRFGEQHHLIDPRSSTSAATSIQTVTVIAATGARAEALAKSGFLREPAEFLAWLPTVGGAALLIDADGAQYVSANWERYS
ncbi:MAG: FAD:protein FMN transferase [Salinibacterium sp.]|nr:MAG: FAD:protein FMN transferase [Salinibacterium sp.]